MFSDWAINKRDLNNESRRASGRHQGYVLLTRINFNLSMDK